MVLEKCYQSTRTIIAAFGGVRDVFGSGVQQLNRLIDIHHLTQLLKSGERCLCEVAKGEGTIGVARWTQIKSGSLAGD